MAAAATTKATNNPRIIRTLSPGDEERILHETIKSDRINYMPDGESIKRYRDYIEGKTLPILTERQKEVLDGLLGNKWSFDLALITVAQARDRCVFQSWECENVPVKEFLEKLYKLERIEQRQSLVHFDAFADGDTVLALDWDRKKSKVTVTREKWWDGSEGVFIGYDTNDLPKYGVKDWLVPTYDGATGAKLEDTAVRRNVWLPGELRRYVSYDRGNSWSPYQLEEDEGVWPLPWKKRDGEPLAIPYIHFINSRSGEVVYGTSELAGGTLGMIDQINDLMLSMSGLGRQEGFRLLYAAGLQIEKDAAGEDKPIEAGQGTMLTSPDPNFKVGSVEAGNPEGVIRIYETKVKAYSIATRTPAHNITGEWPSGDAILRAEEPAKGKAENQNRSLDTSWTTLGHRAVEIQNAFGTGKLEESTDKAMIEAKFAPTERRDPLSMSVIVNNMQNFISPEEALRLYGYSDADAERITKEKEEASARAAETAAIQFSRGVGRGTELPGKGPVDGEEPDDSAGTSNSDINKRNAEK